ncbi:uncharacterized protein LOC120325826 [Styela clava]
MAQLIKMHHTLISAIFALIISTSASAQDPWKTECVDEFELLLFKQRKPYHRAKSSCEGLGGYLAKVDNERITYVLNATIPLRANSSENTFYIGGNDIDREGDWKWQDSTNVIMRGETGYQNWKWNQPNGETSSNGAVENCLTVGRETYEWVDVSCGGNFYYICQKEFQGPFVGILSLNENQRMCTSTNCSKATQVEWYKLSDKVATDATSRVYQTLQTGSATLNLQNANIADDGSYSCRFRIDKTWNSTAVSYEVAGSPTIHQISNNTCNSNLIISWQPHKNAVGFPHEIEVSPTSSGSTKCMDSPTSGKQSTIITSLSATTTYQIKITACVTKDICPTKYSTTRNVTTGEAILSVESSIALYKDTHTCVISWTLSNKTDRHWRFIYRGTESNFNAGVFAKFKLEDKHETHRCDVIIPVFIQT